MSEQAIKIDMSAAIPDRRSRNLKMIEKCVQSNDAEEVTSLRESLKRRYQIDFLNKEHIEKKFPVLKEGFSWTELRKKLSLREADVSTVFAQFLRAGLQVITNNMYINHPTTYEDWVHVIQSKRDTELYAPNHGVAFPRQVGPSELYPEVGAAALDIQLKNLKYGAMYVLEKELLDDDQSGSFQMQAGKLGEYMKLLAEVLCYGKLASVASMTYINYTVPVSETKPSYEANYPWTASTAPFRGGGSNKASTFTLPTKAAVQAAKIALTNQKNLQGIKMNVVGNRIICGPQNEFDLSILLNSAFYPSGAAAAGSTGGAFAINPIKGIAKLTMSPYVFKNDGTVDGSSFAWYLVDDMHPWFILQLREAMTVEQEAPNAGTSFARDQYRFKGRSRMNADFLDPRFAFQGNDGSVTS